MDGLIDMTMVRSLAALGGGQWSHQVVTLLENFGRDASRTLLRMRDRSRWDDTAWLAAEAHRLRGAAASLGAARFAEDCQGLERAARGGRLADFGRQIEAALGVLAATRAAFRAAFSPDGLSDPFPAFRPAEPGIPRSPTSPDQ